MTQYRTSNTFASVFSPVRIYCTRCIEYLNDSLALGMQSLYSKQSATESPNIASRSQRGTVPASNPAEVAAHGVIYEN